MRVGNIAAPINPHIGDRSGEGEGMSIALPALVILLILGLVYFLWRRGWLAAALSRVHSSRRPPDSGPEFDLPAGYCFHLGHTWMAEQDRGMARIGIDSFAASLLANLQKITVIGEQRWVRQGQKLMTLTGGSASLDLLSPLEGTITAINPEVLQDPGLALRDPYHRGWVCVIRSPEMESNRRNLVPAPMAAGWMVNSLHRLKDMLVRADPALTPNGGGSLHGLLSRLSPDLRRQVVKEFFLT